MSLCSGGHPVSPFLQSIGLGLVGRPPWAAAGPLAGLCPALSGSPQSRPGGRLRPGGAAPPTLLVLICAALLAGCARREQPPAYRVYVTNEASGDLSVIDAATYTVTTIKLGKRPRGIHASPDGSAIYI